VSDQPPRFAESCIDPRSPLYDIACAELRLAEGLPGAEGLDRGLCLRWLDEAARLVAQTTERHFYRFQQRPQDFQHSEGRFRMMWLVTVLQRDLGVWYDLASVPLPDEEFFKHPKYLFLHGIIQGFGGTCSSLPPLYAAVGRRLNYPLKLVKAAQHCFVRWEGRGERFNIEATTQGFVSHPDEHYLTWPHPVTPEVVREYRLLKSETPEEEVAGCLCKRGHVFLETGEYRKANWEYVQAYCVAPGRQLILQSLLHCVFRWRRHVDSQLFAGFPDITIVNGTNWHRDFSRALASDINYCTVVEFLLNDPEKKALWWDPLRRDPKSRPPGLPERFEATFCGQFDSRIKVEACAPPERDTSRIEYCPWYAQRPN
jgi:hypothetical protein